LNFPEKSQLKRVVELALKEDIGTGDITSEISVGEDIKAQGNFIAREDIVLAGLPVVTEIYNQISPDISIEPYFSDGNEINKDKAIMAVKGNARDILSGERVALNFLQRMSGIATATSIYARKIEGTGAILLDTRKTTPLLRIFEKYSVFVGGGKNHRFGLYDQFLIKDNHIAAGTSDFETDIKNIVEKARNFRPYCKIEIEVDTLDQLKKVLNAKPDIVLLDNFSIENLKQAVFIAKGKVFLEASGGINLDTIREIAETGVDGISVGALTHSARSVDISLDIEICPTKK